MDHDGLATHLRHYGLASIDLAAVLRDELGDRDLLAADLHRVGIAAVKRAADLDAPMYRLPVYEPSGPVLEGVEVTTARLSCCGAGPDQRDERTGERLHLPGCRTLGLAGVAAARTALQGAR